MKIVIVGAGGHAKVVAECLDDSLYEVVGFLDKDREKTGLKIGDYTIIGSDADGEKYKREGVEGCIIAIGHIGDSRIRNKLYETYKKIGFLMVNAIHKRSYISKSAHLENGIVVMPNAIINAGVHIGENSIINSGAIIEHDAIIGTGVHAAPGSIVAGGVCVSDNVLLGAGAIILQGRKIGENAVIGAGAVVTKDVLANQIIVGNPGKPV